MFFHTIITWCCYALEEFLLFLQTWNTIRIFNQHILSMCVCECVSLFHIVASSIRREEICSLIISYTYTERKITEFEMTFDTQSKWEWLCRQKFDSLCGVWREQWVLVWSGSSPCKRIMYTQTQSKKCWRKFDREKATSSKLLNKREIWLHMKIPSGLRFTLY